MIKWKIFVPAILHLQLAIAMRAFNGACPSNMSAVGDLDMERFKGKWYTHSMYPNLSLRVPKCQSTDFVEEEENKFRVEARELSNQTGTVKMRKADILNIEPQFGRYILGTRNTAFPEGVLMYVLDTDYVNFAIRFMCFDASKIISFHWAVIQTRKRLPTVQVIYMAQYYGRKAGLEIGFMSKVPQESCPHDT
ncbi:uncharacterized protein LOC6541873 [Drosophila erecta]|uniref:Lipocalin/cytosolic fatty-acid binding domain-containing protein n=1 Tax=Drosophila erecta TaxID=7220 RepID=B3N8U4_DROER|nr:uncharacterized protein LOC6541873 [Drosophila erecta]EDV57344.1 uncharacterized protein Dere_GG24594 [Drosophila erecta]